MNVQRLDAAPPLTRLYARAAITATGRRGDQLPDVSYELADVTIDRAHLASYQEVCGFRHDDQLPPTYPHVLGFPLAAKLMVEPAFPFALPGMVHLQNRITQQRPILADEMLAVRVHATNLREHPRGRQFDMITEASVGSELVWSETSTYLRRERRGPRSSSSPAPTSPEPAAEAEGGGRSIWRVPADTGRRYAAVSGDVNPIHLNPLVARLFGFRRAIVHGMWLKARCLAALEGRLPDHLAVDVEFKSPLLLPSTVDLTTQATGNGWSFAVADRRSGRPHLIGKTD
jgi:acyl dehydratase